MVIRKDIHIEKNLCNIEKFNNRVDIRNYLLEQWRQESPSTKYRYFVEILQNGNRIYLERPGQLNKGCDFVIYLENIYLWKNGNDRPPNHDFVLDDLTDKKTYLDNKQWECFLKAVEVIYNCGKYEDASKIIEDLPELKTYSYELLLKLIRWYLIEQDITYWLGNGRRVLYKEVISL